MIKYELKSNLLDRDELIVLFLKRIEGKLDCELSLFLFSTFSKIFKEYLMYGGFSEILLSPLNSGEKELFDKFKGVFQILMMEECEKINSEFLNKKSTKKGEIGEEISDKILKEKGIILYSPTDNNSRHGFDRFGINKDMLVRYEIKSHGKLEQYHANWISNTHYKEYQGLNKKEYTDLDGRTFRIPLYLVFVDESPKEKRMYGCFLDKLMEPIKDSVDGHYYPYHNTKFDKIWFSLDSMDHIADLGDFDLDNLRSVSVRTRDY